MQITFQHGAFLAQSRYEEKDVLKKAGFLFHKSGHCTRPKCYLCANRLAAFTGWWTRDTIPASRLRSVCDKLALEALEAVTAAVETSRAMSADLQVPCPEGRAFRPFQLAGVRYMLERSRTLLGDEMGVGKSAQCLGLVNVDPSISNVLVIAPASLRINWQREANMWLTRPFVFHIVENDDPIPAEATFVIANYDRVIKPSMFEQLMARSWDLLVVDEVQKCKGGEKTQRGRAIIGVEAKPRKKIAAEPGLVSRARRVVFVTGTPLMNRVSEMWPIVHALAPDIFDSWWKFVTRYCDAQHTRFGMQTTGSSNLEELQLKLRSSVMIRRLKRDVMPELPPKTRQVVVLPTNGARTAVTREKAAYEHQQAVLEELRSEVDLAHAQGNKQAYEAAVAKLRAGASLAFEEISEARHALALEKAPKVIEYVNDLLESEGKVILFGHHRDVLHKFKEAWGDDCVLLEGATSTQARQDAVDRFQNDPTCKVFVGSITAAGVGLTLTAARVVVFAELDWVPANVTQGEDRAHRMGAKGNVLILHLVFDESLDCRMAEILVEKQNIADKTLDEEGRLELNIPVLPTSPRSQRPSTYPIASDEMRVVVGAALMQLARACDGASKRDLQGFNKFDTHMGKSLAQRASTRPLTDGEVWLARRLLRKYQGQLDAMTVALLFPRGSEK